MRREVRSMPDGGKLRNKASKKFGAFFYTIFEVADSISLFHI